MALDRILARSVSMISSVEFVQLAILLADNHRVFSACVDDSILHSAHCMSLVR